MTVYVETDFLVALAKDDDWLQERAETLLERRDVVTDAFAYLELCFVIEDRELDHVRLFANLLDVVPVADDRDRQVVLKAAGYVEEGMTPFDAFHAATAETDGRSILSSDGAYDAVDPERVPLEPESTE